MVRGSTAMRGCAVIISMASIALGSCVQPQPPPRFVHANATQQTYMQDRFVCIQQAQQQRSGANWSQYGGSSGSTVVVSNGIFMACMAAKGYRVSVNGPLISTAA